MYPADKYLRLLLDRYQAMHGPLAETLVVCFADHGEDLGGWYDNDHAGERGHPYEEGHGCLLHDATLHVPLVFSGPGIPQGRRVRAQVRLTDVMPTVLDLLGLDPVPSDGQPLTGFLAADAPENGVPAGEGPRPAYSETFFPEEKKNVQGTPLTPLACVRQADGDSRSKVIWQVGGPGAEVYDLAADPTEMAPMRLTRPAELPPAPGGDRGA